MLPGDIIMVKDYDPSPWRSVIVWNELLLTDNSVVTGKLQGKEIGMCIGACPERQRILIMFGDIVGWAREKRFIKL